MQNEIIVDYRFNEIYYRIKILRSMLLRHSSSAVGEGVGLARWLEATSFVATVGSVVAVVAAVDVTNEAAEIVADGFETVAELVYFAVGLNTGAFVGVT